VAEKFRGKRFVRARHLVHWLGLDPYSARSLLRRLRSEGVIDEYVGNNKPRKSRLYVVKDPNRFVRELKRARNDYV
jgi:ribosomal protein S25